MSGRRLHRRLSVWAALAVIGWALSGLTHPLMSLLGPRAARFAPPSPVIGPLPEGWASGLQHDGVTALSGLRQVILDGEVVLQLQQTPGAPLRYAARASGPYQDRDADYAAELARHYAGREPARVASFEHITAFSDRYPSVNRILPVWRVRFDDGLELDVSTAEGRLVGVSDARRRALSAVFRNVHTLAPLQPWPWLRVSVMLALLAAIWVLAFAGLRMLWQRGGQGRVRRLHRWGGALLFLPLLAWSGTGALHLLHGRLAPAAATPDWATVPPEALTPLAALDLRQLWLHEGEVWGLDPDGHYQNGRQVLSPAEMAQKIAGVAGQVSLVTTFAPDYGFINRRLPVWRVTGADGQRRFVDLMQGRVVAQVSAVDRAELWTFTQIHKWQLADGLGRAARDAVMSAFAALLLALAIAGLWLRLRRRKSGSRA